MRKILAVAILSAASLIGTACADNHEPSEANTAPAEINHADSIYYPHPDFYNMPSTADRIILPHYPTRQQETEYSCGPAAALTVLEYFGRKDFDEPKLIEAMQTKPLIGTSLGNMVKFFQSLGWNVQSSLSSPPMDEFEFQKFVMENLAQGKPILVENVEWGGHWRVIIGCDALGTPDNLSDDVLIFAEPYDTGDHNQDGYAIGSLDRFYYMWFDHNILPEAERNQPWLIATPKEDSDGR